MMILGAINYTPLSPKEVKNLVDILKSAHKGSSKFFSCVEHAYNRSNNRSRSVFGIGVCHIVSFSIKLESQRGLGVHVFLFWVVPFWAELEWNRNNAILLWIDFPIFHHFSEKATWLQLLQLEHLPSTIHLMKRLQPETM